jgi:hypothetical protein
LIRYSMTLRACCRRRASSPALFKISGPAPSVWSDHALLRDVIFPCACHSPCSCARAARREVCGGSSHSTLGVQMNTASSRNAWVISILLLNNRDDLNHHCASKRNASCSDFLDRRLGQFSINTKGDRREKSAL